ncbi:MAG: hypothetical protein JNM79_05440 [Burkholderiales bacterium]|nr:hypothetical protein [Burkholderiales bacterium]
MLPLGPALVIKLLVWTLAFALFARATARSLAGSAEAARQPLLKVLLGALVGSKLLHALTFPALLFDEPARAVLLVASGDSVPGALIGARLALGFSGGLGGTLADRLLPGTAIALVVLHLGAALWALRGSDFGAPTDLPWGVDFGDGVARHPVMFYEAAFLCLAWMSQRSLGHGSMIAGVRADTFLVVYLSSLAALAYLKPPFRVAALPEIFLPMAHAYAGFATAEQLAILLAGAVLARGLVLASRKPP